MENNTANFSWGDRPSRVPALIWGLSSYSTSCYPPLIPTSQKAWAAKDLASMSHPLCEFKWAINLKRCIKYTSTLGIYSGRIFSGYLAPSLLFLIKIHSLLWIWKFFKFCFIYIFVSVPNVKIQIQIKTQWPWTKLVCFKNYCKDTQFSMVKSNFCICIYL